METNKGKFTYAVFDKLMKCYQFSNDYFDTLHGCLDAIQLHGKEWKKYYRDIELCQITNDEGSEFILLFKIRYKNNEYYIA